MYEQYDVKLSIPQSCPQRAVDKGVLAVSLTLFKYSFSVFERKRDVYIYYAHIDMHRTRAIRRKIEINQTVLFSDTEET